MKKNGRFYALKILKKFDIVKLKQVDHVLHENSILAEIDHPFLVGSLHASRCRCAGSTRTPATCTLRWSTSRAASYLRFSGPKAVWRWSTRSRGWGVSG